MSDGTETRGGGSDVSNVKLGHGFALTWVELSLLIAVLVASLMFALWCIASLLFLVVSAFGGYDAALMRLYGEASKWLLPFPMIAVCVASMYECASAVCEWFAKRSRGR